MQSLYHPECISKWLQKNDKCPVCKQSVRPRNQHSGNRRQPINRSQRTNLSHSWTFKIFGKYIVSQINFSICLFYYRRPISMSSSRGRRSSIEKQIIHIFLKIRFIPICSEICVKFIIPVLSYGGLYSSSSSPYWSPMRSLTILKVYLKDFIILMTQTDIDLILIYYKIIISQYQSTIIRKIKDIKLMDSPKQKGKVTAFICIFGNDGTGKSSICDFINQCFLANSENNSKQDERSSNYFCVERSMLKNDKINELSYYDVIQRHKKSIQAIIQSIKKFDLLTYSYSFEQDWYNYKPISQVVDPQINQKIPVIWVMISAPINIITQRINKRLQMTIYQHPKCIYYFNRIYDEMTHFYGIATVQNYNRDISQTVQQVFQFVDIQIKQLAVIPMIKQLSPEYILNNNIQCKIYQKLQIVYTQQQIDQIFQKEVIQEIRNSEMKDFYLPQLTQHKLLNAQLKKLMISKWIKNHCTQQIVHQEGRYILLLKVKSEFIDKSIDIYYGKDKLILFQQKIQGQSKIIFKILTPFEKINKLYEDKVLILLKGTIYSHTKQTTGQIKQLPEIRAIGSMLFLEMLKRNQIQHSYISINKKGVILSKYMQTNNLQVVFKKEWLGTDKYSFYGLNQVQQLVQQKQKIDKQKDGKKQLQNIYKGGIYVRFDWRNPNHILLNHNSLLINQDPYYYIIQKHLNKQQFFKQYLSDTKKCKAIGDKCITQDLIANQYVQTQKIKQLIIQMYCTFQYYANSVGLQILDGCCMIDCQCKTIWSQINPDCLRVKSLDMENQGKRIDYDKDIWRIGGSASKDKIVEKWKVFNQIFSTYFQKHRFMKAQMATQQSCKKIYAKKLVEQGNIRPQYLKFYRNVIRQNRNRRVIGTIDISNSSPILVQESVVKQQHSQGSIMSAWNYIKIMPQVVVIDIDGAYAKNNNNQQMIAKLARKDNNNILAVGGGIRTLQKAKRMLQLFGKIIISTNLQLIEQLSKEYQSKVIVELSVDQNNKVLTHARTVNTEEDIIQKIIQLYNKYQIKNISITFKKKQGRLEGLPRQQLKDIMERMPGPIENIIIAGGISSIEDLQFIWGFYKCIPQLGSAIWKGKIKIGQIYTKLVKYDQNGLINTIIKNRNGQVLGLVHLNQEAILRTCEQRVLYRYSRQHQKLMKKGQTSNNIQKVVSMNIDCDNDCLLVTVDICQKSSKFCHNGLQSCFYNNQIQNHRKNIQDLQNHILKSKQSGKGYASFMQNRPNLTIKKIEQELNQIALTGDKELKLEEGADILAHFLMYLNSNDLKVSDIIGILNQRSNKIKLLSKVQQPKKQQKKIIKIGLGIGKHSKYIKQFTQNSIGIRVLKNEQQNRCFIINYQICDKQKFATVFNLKMEQIQKTQLQFISTKPKDMQRLIVKKLIDYGINYSNIISVFCEEIKIISQKVIQELKLALIKRKNEKIDINQWGKGSNRKGLIVSQYPHYLVKYFTEKGISTDKYTVIKITGHSESYLHDTGFDYCDAIVQTGRTLEQNNLEIQSVLLDKVSTVLFKV